MSVVLDEPTRDGDTEINVLTNLPAKDAHAEVIANLYRRRWAIETAFQELEATLDGEINTLGYPKAALFAFCVVLLSYNVLSTVKAALRAVHGADVITEQFSGYYLADEVRMNYRGMMRAIPKDEWVESQEMAPEELAAVLVTWARTVPLSEYRKSHRGPKKPKPTKTSGAKIKLLRQRRYLKLEKSVQTYTFRGLVRPCLVLKIIWRTSSGKPSSSGASALDRGLDLSRLADSQNASYQRLAPSGFRWKSHSNMRSMSTSA